MPASEFYQHKAFWKENRWGMNDDLQAISISNYMKSKSAKVRVEPWQVKEWTTQQGYTFRKTNLFRKPVAAIRKGFMSIVNAVKGARNV